MSIFFTVVISIYTLMHAVVFWGIHPLLRGHSLWRIATLVWLALMIAAPLGVRMMERQGIDWLARPLAFVSFIWMGLVFMAFCAFAVVAVAQLGIWLIGLATPGLRAFSLHAPAVSLGVIGVVLLAGWYGTFIEARNLRVERHVIETDKLAPGRDRVRIAQISDVHLGLLNREGTLAYIVWKLREIEPDLLVATGDLVDAEISHMEELTRLWLAIDPPLGKFAVTGNHEVYAGLKQSIDYMRGSGFTMLRGEARRVNGGLTLAGVDDERIRGKNPADEIALLKAQPKDRFTVLLKHRPEVAEGTAGLFDLQLSGHAHLGQIFPFRYITALHYPMQDGMHALKGGSRLYASRGTATWGPPMRVLSPPEISVFDIIRKP